MQPDPRRRRSGLTLMELVIAVALLGVVGLAFAFLYANAQRNLMQTMAISGTQGEASFALEHIKRRLFQADSITTPAVGVTGATLEFTFQRALGSPTVTAAYQLQGSDLQYREDAGAPEVVARNILTVTFNRTDAGTVEVEITARQRAPADPPGVFRETRLGTIVNARGVSL